jgi:hypothetical protein
MFKLFYTLLSLIFITTNSFSQITVGLIQNDFGALNDGYVLFAPVGSTSTFLVDKCGEQVKTWPSTYKPGQSCYILADGTLVRAGNTNNLTFNAGGKGGIIEKINWDGTVTWSYTISDTNECQHHDFKVLPNGNVLAIVWESKTFAEAIAEGRNPALTTTSVWSEKIIEIQPVGATGGVIVWEWHLWDHLVQDFDNTKSNFGAISSSPELLNVNYSASSNTTSGRDWIHMNSIDYNASLDQILLSSHAFDEIWIIDHSTTTAQAASHAGGNSGQGGDLLYRWGNPQAYENGNVSTQKLFGQHNARWIESGMPFQNEIMIFNNGNGRTGGNFSTIEIIKTPVDGFNYNAALPYLPSSTSWIYNGNNENNFYAQNISGAQQLSNGNVIFCSGPNGIFSEIDSLGNSLWKYINPISSTGIITQSSTPTQNQVFRCSFYPSNFTGFVNQTLTPFGIIENTNSNTTICAESLGINEGVTNNNSVQIYPNPANQIIHIELDKNKPILSQIEIFDYLGRTMYKNTEMIIQNKYAINISEYPRGLYLIILKSSDGFISKKIIIE